MTRAELSLHHEAQRRLNEARELYKQMRLRAYPKAQTIDDMPKATGTGRKVEELALVLSDLSDKVDELQAAAELTRPAVLEYIHTIDEPRTRMIVSLRVLCGLTWERVGYYMATEPTAAKQRYFEILKKLS